MPRAGRGSHAAWGGAAWRQAPCLASATCTPLQLASKATNVMPNGGVSALLCHHDHSMTTLCAKSQEPPLCLCWADSFLGTLTFAFVHLWIAEHAPNSLQGGLINRIVLYYALSHVCVCALQNKMFSPCVRSSCAFTFLSTRHSRALGRR